MRFALGISGISLHRPGEEEEEEAVIAVLSVGFFLSLFFFFGSLLEGPGNILGSINPNQDTVEKCELIRKNTKNKTNNIEVDITLMRKRKDTKVLKS